MPAAQRLEKRLPRNPLVFLLLVVALVAIVGAGASLCSAPGASSSSSQPYRSPYDWANLDWSSERPVYRENGVAASRLGVDVSDHQGYIDWSAVASDGIDFAFVRVGNRGYTEGAIQADDYFSYNVDAAASAGLDVGVYFFSQAITPDEAREEAQFVLDQLAGRQLDLPVVFDHEPITTGSQGRADDVSGADLIACEQAFCETIEAAGYETAVYGNQQDMARYSALDGTASAADALAQALGSRSVWFAEYGVAAPTAPFDFTIWQFSSTATVAGIDTQADLNIMLP